MRWYGGSAASALTTRQAHVKRCKRWKTRFPTRLRVPSSTSHSLNQPFQYERVASGGGGIRTRGPRERTPVFKTGAFDHSATPPDGFNLSCRAESSGLLDLGRHRATPAHRLSRPELTRLNTECEACRGQGAKQGTHTCGASGVARRGWHCCSRETQITWNRHGQPGVPGAAGAKGDPGAPGAKGDPGAPGAPGALPAGSYVFMASSRVRATGTGSTNVACFIQARSAANSNFVNVNLGGIGTARSRLSRSSSSAPPAVRVVSTRTRPPGTTSGRVVPCRFAAPRRPPARRPRCPRSRGPSPCRS